MPRHLIISESGDLVEINTIGHRINAGFRAGNVFGVTVGALLEFARADEYFLPDA